MKAQEVKTFLWFQSDLDNALNFYKSLFPSFKLLSEQRINDSIFLAEFEISNQKFIAMNTPGGDKFNNAISISVQVSGQEEVDRLWNAITKEGEEKPCGWCKDMWGIHWQIVPFELGDWISNSDPEVAQYAFQAMMKMKKIIIADLQK